MGFGCRRAFFIAGLIFLVVASGQARIFTDVQGRKVDAEKVKVENGNVTLRLATGANITVPLKQLSAADQAFLTGPETPNPPPAVAAASPLTWDYEAEVRRVPDLKVARFRIWLPDAVKPVRGMIVLVPGSNGDGRGDAEAPDWQALAREINFGLIACNFESLDPNGSSYCYAANGSGKLLLDTLAEFATAKNHAEIARAPLLLWGHSAGGQFNYNFACWKADQTLAFIVNKGGYYYEADARPMTRSTPAILFAGEVDTADRVKNITALFERGRSKGALWALCVEKGVNHDVGRSPAIARQFFRAVVAKRLPPGAGVPVKTLTAADGLLVAKGGPAVPAAQFKGRARDASWLPDAATETVWAAAQ